MRGTPDSRGNIFALVTQEENHRAPLAGGVSPTATMQGQTLSRREFLRGAGAAVVSATTSRGFGAAASAQPRPTLLFNCDFNWALAPLSTQKPKPVVRPSMPDDWAEVDARKYFDWHVRFGNNAIYCQAYCSSGYALYPSRLGPVGKGNAGTLFPRLYELARNAGMPVWSYLNVAADLFMAREHPEWIIPDSVRNSGLHEGFFGPETPRTALLAARIREFLRDYPVDWLLLDWFAYGALAPNGGAVQPAPFVKEPFRRLIGRPMPETAAQINPEENLVYKRATLAEQFQNLRQAVKETSPSTHLIFNVPYHRPREELWVDHPMLRDSDGLFAESSDDVVDWLLEIRKPTQSVMTTIIGRTSGESDPNTWQKWHRRGCDFFGYAFATPPSFEPAEHYAKDLEITRKAFAQMSGK